MRLYQFHIEKNCGCLMLLPAFSCFKADVLFRRFVGYLARGTVHSIRLLQSLGFLSIIHRWFGYCFVFFFCFMYQHTRTISEIPA